MAAGAVVLTVVAVVGSQGFASPPAGVAVPAAAPTKPPTGIAARAPAAPPGYIIASQ